MGTTKTFRYMKDKRTVEQVIARHKDSGKFFTVDGVQTFALDQGSGEAVLCLHGVPTSSFLYRNVVRSLAQRGFRGVSIDLPGLGLADRPADFDYSFGNFARFLANAAQQLGLEKYHLVVHDIGGPIGFALAATHPDRILSLTILNTWVDVVNFQKPMPMRPFEKRVIGELQLAALRHRTWYMMFKSVGTADHERITKEEAYAYVDLLKREDGGKAFLKIMRNFDHSVEFRDLCLKAVKYTPYPVQVIWGAEDPGLTFRRYGFEIMEAAELEHLYTLKASHLLQEERWEEIAQRITELAYIG